MELLLDGGGGKSDEEVVEVVKVVGEREGGGRREGEEVQKEEFTQWKVVKVRKLVKVRGGVYPWEPLHGVKTPSPQKSRRVQLVHLCPMIKLNQLELFA